MYKVLLFDLDGTLTDSSEGITKSLAYALHEMGVDYGEREQLKRFIGPPLSVSFSEFFSGEDIQKAVNLYRKRYSEIGWKENRVYDGVKEMLARLKENGLRIFMATSKPEIYAVRIADYFDLTRYFEFIGGATTDGTRNDKSDVIKYVLDRFGTDRAEDALMIGDRWHDVEGAAAFGIKTLGVAYGFGSREELLSAGAVYVAKTPSDVADYVLRHML